MVVKFMNDSYKKVKLLYLIGSFILIILFSCIVILFNKKIIKYRVFDGIVFSDSLVVLMVDSNDLDLFYTNSYVFINNKKIKFELYKVDKDILKRDNKYYSEIYLKMDFNKYKENDVLKISILDEKIYSYRLFDVIWR